MHIRYLKLTIQTHRILIHQTLLTQTTESYDTEEGSKTGVMEQGNHNCFSCDNLPNLLTGMCYLFGKEVYECQGNKIPMNEYKYFHFIRTSYD